MTKILQKHMPDAFKRVARMVGYSLLLGDTEAWHRLTVVLSARLTPEQRAAIAWAALRSLTPGQVAAVAETVLPQRAGQPIALLFNYMDEAAFWADMASEGELKAYALASFTRLSPDNQAAFLDYVQERAAA